MCCRLRDSKYWNVKVRFYIVLLFVEYFHLKAWPNQDYYFLGVLEENLRKPVSEGTD